MLCNLAVRVSQEGIYTLRITGRTALGPSGTGGRDEKHYLTAEALLSGLGTFGLGSAVAAAAVRVLSNPAVRERFLNFAEDAQIPFEILERAEIHLFD